MKKIISFILILIFAFTLSSCKENAPKKNVIEANQIFSKFDTTIIVYIASSDSEKSKNFNYYFTEVSNMLDEYHKFFDKYKSYNNVVNIYSINHRESNTLTLDPKLIEALDIVLKEQEITKKDGKHLFNIALGPVLELWHDTREECGYDPLFGETTGACKAPDNTLLNAEYNTNPNDIILDKENNTITLKEGMKLDVGGFGKGYVAEIIADYLEEQGLSYVINAGQSNIKFHLEEGDIWYENVNIKITDPNSTYFETIYYGTISLPSNKVIITSGDYQRYYYDDVTNELYHHIIDPRTNYPGKSCRAVTLIGEDGGIGDIYSTYVFLLSIEEGLEFINNLDGYEAIWYGLDGTIYKSNGMDNYLINNNTNNNNNQTQKIIVSIVCITLIVSASIFLITRKPKDEESEESKTTEENE